MRALLLIVAIVCTAAAQTAPGPTIAVVDDNGVAVPSARVSLEAPQQPTAHCETNHTGRCSLPGVVAGQYQLHVEKEGFYVLEEPAVQITPGATVEVAISRQQEVKEVVDVHESAPAIDPAQVASRETLSGLDVVNMVYPGTNDYRNGINFIPGVVNDQTGQPHVAGAQTYQTVTLLDGFNVTQPANGQLLIRVSTDAFRSIQVEPSREPAEAGKGSGGLLLLNTGIGDDHFRFWATNFIPSVQNKHGWRFDQFLPLLTFSGPIVKRRMWFYNSFDGEYDNLIYTALPVGQDNDHIVRFGNLTKLQTNITSRNILTTSFLVNHLHDQYAYLSPQSPQLSNPKDVEYSYFPSIKDQHYFANGMLVETGLAFVQYDINLTPYGTNPYFVNTETAGGNFYLNAETTATRWQGLSNVYLPPQHWHGRHDFKVGVDLDKISYDAHFNRQPISYLSDDNPLTSANLCLTSPQNAMFPCTRYSTFSPAPLIEQSNSEVSAYAEDRWSITNRLLIEPGVRFDWDTLVHHKNFAPRLAGTYVLDDSGTTKISAGIGVIYELTPIFLIARPYAGTRQDTFFNTNPNCTTPTGCVAVSGPVTTTFTANTADLESPRFLNWSVGLEKKLPAAIYMKAEYFRRRGINGFVYDSRANSTTGDFDLLNTRQDHYDAFQITLRRNFHETYSLMGSYTRSSTRSNQALDFNVDSPILAPQQPGPYPGTFPTAFSRGDICHFFRFPSFIKRRSHTPWKRAPDSLSTKSTINNNCLGSPGRNVSPTISR